MRLIQGSTYEIPITLKVNGIAITPEDVDKVEIDIGRSTIKKTYPAGGGVLFANDIGKFVLCLTAEDTLALSGCEPIQAKIFFKNGQKVKQSFLKLITVSESLAGEVLS